MRLILPPIEMPPAVMQDLEDRGLILRLAPGRFGPKAKHDEPAPNLVYCSSEECGPHKLTASSLNTTDAVKNFVHHPDREEFLLIGDPASITSYLVVSLLLKETFEAKARAVQLTQADLVALQMKFYDPQVCFFTMNAFVPHGEMTVANEGLSATFFVTESRDIKGEEIDRAGYTWDVVPG